MPRPGVEQTPTLAKALRKAQLRAQRRPTDLAAQLRAAKLSYEVGQYHAAYRAYRQAVVIEPESYEALVGLARTNLKLRSPAEGLDWVGRARRIKPDDRELVELEGRLYLLSGRVEPSLAAFRRATQMGAASASTWLNLASAYGIVRQYPQAVAAAREAVRLAPTSAPAHFALGHYLQKTGDIANAETQYRRAVELNPQDPTVLTALARLLVDTKRKLPEARDLAIKAGQAQTGHADAAILAAWVLHLQGEERRAADELIRLVTRMPQTPEAWEKLAVVLRALRKYEEAARCERMAQKYLPSAEPRELDFFDTQ